MKIWPRNINGIFCALAVICVLSGCKTTEEKKLAKEKTLIKVHLEIVPAGRPDEADVPVFRERPIMIHIDTKEILNNADITGASVVDVQGGYGIRIAFDAHGTRVLENISARNAGKRLVIYSAWPEVRWLAAPMIMRRIGNGELIFTPDATKEETERIVNGINNIAKKVAKGRWP